MGQDKDDTEGSESEETNTYDCELCQQNFGSKIDLEAHEEGLVHMLMEKTNVGVEPKNRPIDLKGQEQDVELKEQKLGLAHMLMENAQKTVELQNKQTTPKERARPLDQGLSETCTLHAIANATVESLTERDIDVKLDEVLGALKQAEYVNVYEGNKVEEFHGAVMKRLTNKKTGKSVDVKLTVAKCNELRKNEDFAQNQHSIKFVLVYNLNRPNDPEAAWHCVYIHKYDTIRGKKKLVCFNSWGEEEENPVVDVDRPGNVVYGVVTQCEESRPSRCSSSKSVSDDGMFSTFTKFFNGWGQSKDQED